MFSSIALFSTQARITASSAHVSRLFFRFLWNETLKKIPNCIIIPQVNISSIKSKFEKLEKVIGTKLLVSETKLDDTFSLSQFSPERFTPSSSLQFTPSCNLVRLEHGGG